MSDISNSGTFLQASSPIDSALFFVFAAFILNVIVVIKQKGKDREPVDQQHHPPPATSPAPSQHPRNSKMQAARVCLPVGVYKEFEVNRGSEGEALFRQVTSDLSIEERDYFSLCFYDKEEGIRHWLYNDKKILKQLKNLP
uniref:FERM domain-containing protein n=2 Tax=Caenorhabditis japonica TaxID=281687 RepID=A0A8R1E7K1_CAEJA